MSDEHVEREIAQLRNDVAALRDDVARLVGALSSSGKREADEAVGKARERLRRAAAALGDAKVCTEQSVEALEQHVRRHPLLWLAGAFSAGCFCGKLFGRSK